MELREALMSVQFGQGIGDGRFLHQIFSVNPRPADVPIRPSVRDDGDSTPRDRELVLATLGTAQAPGAGSPLAPIPFERPAALDLTLHGSSVEAAGPGQDNERVLSLQVGIEPVRDEKPGLITSEGIEQIGQREGFLGGWLESYVRFYAPAQMGMPGIEFHNAAPGDLEYFTSITGPADSRIDTLALSGDFSSGFTLGRAPATITELVLRDGNDYALELDDSFVEAGRQLTVHGEFLTLGGRILFDGSAETDGSFSFFGGAGDDFAFGGAGDDVLRGLGGADTLSGGGGDDVFLYRSAAESTGGAFDILADFDPAGDRIDLPVTVTGFDAAVQSGALSADSAAQDLAAALGGLGAGHAVLFTPDAGDLAGTLFLVVDGNGVAGYQEGEDYVFALPATPPADLGAHPDFFI